MSRWMKHAALVVFVSLTAASGGCRQAPWTLWEAYASHFINPDGRVMDHSANDHSTSEGQSYALFFALADNDRARFDKLLSWTQNNLAGGDMSKRLPGWLWGRSPEGEWKLLDPNPASDADCWIAYSLIEGGRLWSNPAYAQLGRQILGMIAKQEVAELPGFGKMLMPGTTALWVHHDAWTVNPSYVPAFLLQRFAEVDPAGPWGAIATNVPGLLRQSARRGFAMDWVDYVPGSGFSAAPPPGANPPSTAVSGKTPVPVGQKGAIPAMAQSDKARQASASAAAAADAKPAVGSYDAIRVYLWAGMMDASGRLRADVLNSIGGMGEYLSSGDRAAPPEKVSADGMPGRNDGPVGFSAAVIPYLRLQPDRARAAVRMRVNVGAQRDSATGLYGKQPVYYDQNLALFALGYLDDRFRFGPRGELTVGWKR